MNEFIQDLSILGRQLAECLFLNFYQPGYSTSLSVLEGIFDVASPDKLVHSIVYERDVWRGKVKPTCRALHAKKGMHMTKCRVC